jgi:hypothetical protein
MGSRVLIISNTNELVRVKPDQCKQTNADHVGHGTQSDLYASGIEGGPETTEGIYGNQSREGG